MVQPSTCLPIVYSGGWTDKCIAEKAFRSKRFIDSEHIKYSHPYQFRNLNGSLMEGKSQSPSRCLWLIDYLGYNIIQ